MIHLRVWATSNTAIAGFRYALIASIVAFAAVAPAAAAADGDTRWLHGPDLPVAVALLAAAALHATVALLLPRRRSVRVRAVTVPVEPLAMVPGTVAPHPAFKGCVGWGATNTPSRYFPAGWARRPAAARLSPASAAAGPELVGVTR